MPRVFTRSSIQGQQIQLPGDRNGEQQVRRVESAVPITQLAEQAVYCGSGEAASPCRQPLASSLRW